MCLLIILFSVRRLRQLSQGMYEKVTYIRMRKFMIQKRKFLFIPIKVQLITINSVVPYIPYTSRMNSTSNSLKKKSLKREKERGKERKTECERKGKIDGKEKEKEKEEEEEGEKIEKAILKSFFFKYASLSRCIP